MLAPIMLGFAQGARHSLEPDHIAAVSALMGGSQGARRGAWLGALWGLGHTASLVAMCVALVGFGAMFPPTVEHVFKLGVSVLLLVLGVRTLWQSQHPVHDHTVRGPLQAVLFGAIHGMAGSGALTAMVFATLPSSAARLLYITLFSVGSIAGMVLISGSAGLWLHWLRHSRLLTVLRVAIGTLSIVIAARTGLDALDALGAFEALGTLSKPSP
jgi:hypothetical protein